MTRLAPVASLVGLEPIRDELARSVLCRETRYDRIVLETEQATTIEYRPTDMGITFCRTPLPPYPFYPEGVVLAFLQPENQGDTNRTAEDYRVAVLCLPIFPMNRATVSGNDPDSRP